MNTDIEYLDLLEQDLKQAAARENLLSSEPVSRRRTRRSWGTFAAAVVPLLVVAGLIGWLVTGSGGGDGASSVAEQKGGARGLYSATTAPNAPAGLDFSTAPTTADLSATTGPSADVSKIIRDGTMSIQVPKDDFSKGFAAVTRIAENNGGIVLSSQTRGQRVGTLTLRIPANRFDDAMIALREVGTVQAQSVTGRDVTAQFIDLRARLRIAKSRRAALLGFQDEANTIAEILAVQRQLDNAQLQIEQIQGQLNFIRDQVAEATIRVDLREKDAPPPGAPNVRNPSLGGAWDRAVQGFLNVVTAVVIGLGYLIPIGILALAAWLVTLTVRRRRSAG